MGAFETNLTDKEEIHVFEQNKDGCFCITTAWLKDTFLIEQFCFSFYIVICYYNKI